MRALIAILRGVLPSEVEAVAACLIDVGIEQIEVPLNSPDAIDSIRRLSHRFGDHALIGAGTVLHPHEVEQIAAAGGKMIISPNCNPAVIARSRELALTSLPGVITPTECFAALAAGASGLKFFPAFKLGVDGFQALQAVLPKGLDTYAVGGVGAADFSLWLAAGIKGFGIGSALYKPGDSVQVVRGNAERLVSAWDEACT